MAPDAQGNIKGITVPRIPWLEREGTKDAELRAWEEERESVMRRNLRQSEQEEPSEQG